MGPGISRTAPASRTSTGAGSSPPAAISAAQRRHLVSVSALRASNVAETARGLIGSLPGWRRQPSSCVAGGSSGGVVVASSSAGSGGGSWRAAAAGFGFRLTRHGSSVRIFGGLRSFGIGPRGSGSRSSTIGPDRRPESSAQGAGAGRVATHLLSG